ncbi:MAG TPA: phage adaptor protein [Candidatus Wunengus sp. YC61]|uniref:phage adaptor protein n=1 Tax=Candidatus Wunengus sp. YC61 TaxID=3367698 RepID=UPI004024C96E
MTVIECITAALKKINVLATGETSDSDDIADALSELNRMLNSWSASGINLHYRVNEYFSLTAGDGEYSIGDGADFSTTRPIEIEQAFIRDSGNSDHNLKVRPMSEYWALGNKVSSTRPTRLYYDPTYPNGTIHFNTLPSSAETLYLISQKNLLTYADEAGSDSIVLPSEYEDAIVNRLAIKMASYYGKSVSQELAFDDKMSYGTLRSRNLANAIKPARVSMPGRYAGTYNIDEG